jgi:aspartyl-tRNA(Asn)/glutamyl-tRNA(Gln) amidotransferase subunit B
MQEGSFRCDANVSVKKAGDAKLGTRCEIKNLNSFLFMEQAIEFEARRQIEILEDGGTIAQETRLYDPDRGETRSMRSKEDAQDYRYFPDPDLLPLLVSDEMLSKAKASLPELPEVRRTQLVTVYSLTPAQANLLTSSIETSRFAIAAFEGAPQGRWPDIANWITGPLSAKLNESNLDIAASRVSPDQLRRLAEKVEDGTLSGKMVKEVLDAVWAGEGDVDQVIAQRGLQQISDPGAIERVVDEVLAKNAKQVEDYRAGKERAFNSLVGQVMKATQGKANPAQVNEILKAKLGR